MSEGMHSNTVNAGNRSRGRLALIVAGTALAVVAAGVSIQFFRAQPGSAGEEPSAGVAPVKGQAPTLRDGDVVAKVGPITITRDQVAAECYERYAREVIDKMVNRAIIEAACRDRGIEVTAGEVNKEVSEIAKKFNLDTGNWLKMLMAERNITPEQYKHDIIWPMLALKRLAGADVTVNEEDLRKAFIRDYGPRVECKMIMCDNIRRANEVWNKAKESPDDFGRLAREHSVEPTSRALDGDVPPIRRFSGNDNLEKVAFSLKPNEMSGVIEVGSPTTKRYVILLCKGRTDQVVKSIEEVREQLFNQLKEEKTQEAVAKVFEQLKDEVPVVNYYSNKVSGGAQSDRGIRQTSAATPPRGAPEGGPRTGAGPRQQPR